MKIKHSEIIIPEGNPFENCKLDRKKYAEVLTNILKSYKEGFVLAIDNEWGTGKTTFIKMWRQHLNNATYKTLYFNSWENDFESNPLVAILSELKTINTKSDDKAFKSLLKKGALVSKSVIPVIVEAIAKRYIDTEEVVKAIGKLSEAASDILKEEIDEYANKKKGLIEFRTELETFIQENNNDKPIIFFIDELDRCRPDYAVEVLEKVKHFFSVKGIIFILSIDKVQLSNAVKGYYGSEHIDSIEYLRRFIDLEYVLPKPNTATFCNYLYDYFSYNDFFNSLERRKYPDIARDKDVLLRFAILLFENGNATIRQQEKIWVHARIVLSLFSEKSYLFPSLFFLLIYIKMFHNKLYKSILNRQLELQDLVNRLKDVFPANISDDNVPIFTHSEAMLALFYDNYCMELTKKKQMIKFNKELAKDEVVIKSITDPEGSLFLRNWEAIKRTNYEDVKLDYLLNKIDLWESLST